MKVLELFAGTRSIGKAFEARGHEVFSVEWDKRFEDIDLYKDIGELTAKEVIDKFGHPDVIWLSPDCFPAGNLVWTSKGYKNIEDIECGDYVLTHKGNYKKVIRTVKKNDYKFCELKISGCESFLVTPNHPFYARKKIPVHARKNGTPIMYTTLSKPEWINAENLTNDYKVGIPINRNSIIPKWEGCVYYTKNKYGITNSWIENNLEKYMDNEDFWWLIGRYFGDGYVNKDSEKRNSRSEIDICCSYNEINQIQVVLDRLGINYSTRKKKTTYSFSFHSKEFRSFVLQFGCGALNKKITPLILDLPIPLLKKFLDGYISADGHWDYSIKNPVCTISTISRQLAYGLQQCILKAYGRYASLVVRTNVNNIIEGRKVNVRDSYTLSFYRDFTNRLQYIIEDNMAWVNVRKNKILPSKQRSIYTMSVEDDESYTINNIAVHNCTSYSIAAISHHRKKNETTGNLDPVSDYAKFCDKVNQHCLELVKELNPKVYFIENPRGGLRKMTWMQELPRYTVTYCFAGNTKVITDKGHKAFQDICGEIVKVLNKDGEWEEAIVRKYGIDELYKITFSRFDEKKIVYATKNHKWFATLPTNNKENYKLISTNELKPEMLLPYSIPHKAEVKIIPEYVCRGFIFGKGDSSKSNTYFVGEKIEMLPYFDNYKGEKESNNVMSIPIEWKTYIPKVTDDVSKIFSWIAGYLAANGSCSETNGQVTLSSSKIENLEKVKELAEFIGVGTYSINKCYKKGFSEEKTPSYQMTFMSSDIDEKLLLRNEHKIAFQKHYSIQHQPKRWSVQSVEETGKYDSVYCCETKDSHTFTLEDNIVTHNCQYGDKRMKPTDIWTNHPNPDFLPMCKNGDPCHEPAPRGSKTGTQGLKGSIERARIPEKLCEHIVDICEEIIS